MTDQISAICSTPLLHNQHQTLTDQGPASQQTRSGIMSSQPKWMKISTEDTDLIIPEDRLSNGTCEVETIVALHCHGDSGDVAAEADPALSNDGMSEFSNSDLSLPEVCISTNSNSFEDDMNYEVQQAYRIFTGILLDKHKSITSPFLHPVGHQEAQHGIGGVRGWGQAQLKQSMCLRKMEEKFINQEYDTITEFVADFRLMLENCYRYHGVDHWISKQAQKLEIMLEQKLTLLSRTLREKTTLAVTSKGRFGAEEERGSGGTSTRRRLASRSLATITVGGHESIMVQTLRLEEQLRVKEEKRQRELEKKEAEEMSAKEVDEWEQSLLSQASLHSVDTLWELPAIGHFLCLAQTALNLPEIVFFELERCLLMPRCSLLLSKIMSSLLSPPQRRATLHRRPALPYRRWESELRQRVMGWYGSVGAARDQPGRAEQLGLCHQFFEALGEMSPLTEKPFHLLPFYQRVWLLKGLCDHVYETQKDVQDAVLSQPIHECRESILGYDSKENAYIHFPHFCGADLRIYCQSPSSPPAFPFPPFWVKRVEMEPVTEGEESDGIKDEVLKSEMGCRGDKMDTGEYGEFGNGRAESLGSVTRDEEEVKKRFGSWSPKEEVSDSVSSDDESSEDPKLDSNTNSLSQLHETHARGSRMKRNLKETVEIEYQSKRLKLEREQGFTLDSVRTIKAETKEPCLSVGEHCYMGRSPARSVNVAFTNRLVGLKVEGESLTQGHQRTTRLECCKRGTSDLKSEDYNCSCGPSRLGAQLSSESAQNSSEERVNDKIWTKKKKRKKKQGREQLPRVKGEHKQLQLMDRMRLSTAETAESSLQRVATTIKRKEKKKKHRTGKRVYTSKKINNEPSVEPSFKLVCTSLEELRELISKTEDELDELESTKKRLGRWYYKREAVKDLHSTLIRLLNELSPWEPKLVKAYQRNRLRLKKEFDDFRSHPEYNNFVREECISSSSSDDEDEKVFGKEACLLSDQYRRSEEEDLEHVVPKGLWSGASTREFLAESSEERTVTHAHLNHLKHPLDSTQKGIGMLPRVQTGSSNSSFTPDSGPLSRSELAPSNQSGDSDAAWVARLPAQAPLSTRPLHPTTGLPKGYTPIPTLLAKSVGNKVTLMKRPSDCPGVNIMDRQRKESLVSLPTSTVTTTKLTKAQSSPPSSPQNSKQTQAQGSQQTEVVKHTGITKATAALPKSPQVKTSQTVQKSPVQVIYKVPERLGHIVQTESSNPVKISVHPVMDQNTGEKIMQQVVILPSNLLVKNTEDKAPPLDPKQCKGIQIPVSKVASPLCLSTNVPGFTIPENRVPVQQVAPLKDAKTAATLSPSVCPHLQQGATNTAGSKHAQVCTSQGSTTQVIPPKPSNNITPSTAGTTEPAKSVVPKQELKTVCIRDSQSILVTTRGGNTGIVKVQTSSDKNVLGFSPSTPVITISPQFKAFLVSKTSQTPSSQISSCTIPAATSVPLGQPQAQVPSVLKSPSSVTAPMLPATTGSLPVAGSRCQSLGTTAASVQGSVTAIGSPIATKISQQAQVAAADSHFQASLVKNTVVVPSLSSPGVLQGVSKAGMKRQSADNRSQVTKFILVGTSSSSASNVESSKVTLSSAKPIPTSRVMFISQPAVTSTITPMGTNQKQATGTSGQLQTMSSPSHTLKMGLSPQQSVSGVNPEVLSKVKNITLPSGVQIQLTGKTTTIGQTIGALSYSPSKSIPVSVSIPSCPTANTTALTHNPVITSKTTTSCSAQLSSHTSLTTSSKLQGISTIPFISKSSSSLSTSAATPTTGNVIKKDIGVHPGILSSNSPAQVITTVQGSPAQTSSVICQPLKPTSGIVEESLSSSSELALNKIPATVPGVSSTNTPVTTPATGMIQQRIVINTSTPLAAGTQILLNNARFVVPPQGLGPGSHVLIISSPSQQQVPTASAASTAASVPPHGVSHVTLAPRASVLPQSPAGLPSVPAVSAPFVASTPVVRPSLPATAPNFIPVQPNNLGSILHSKTNVVSALPRLPGSFASPSVSTPTLVSSQPRLVGVPALVSSSAPVLGSTLATIRLATGTPMRAECSSTIAPTVAPTLSRLPAPLSSFSLLPNPPAVPLPSPIITVPATISSAAGTPALHPSLPTQQMVSVSNPGPGIQPQHTAIRGPAQSTSVTHAMVNTGLGNSPIRKTVPAGMQPVLAGIRTQVLPTVAVPPIVSAVSRMQTLPIATVPPIGSTVSTCETLPVVTAPALSSTVIISPAQTTSTLKSNNSLHPPVNQTNHALGKHSLQTSSFGMHTSVSSRLLISPDGAVLSTVQGQVNTAKLTACPKPLDTAVVSPNSSTGALHTHDSSVQASQATDRKCTN
ncbi:LOW QUALITY PROTEIN: uncharacterized protein KIAA2026 [Xyrichtys novacula]|uniref:LOW QUALITY PROTEIN: uncharacterized protein KIAA2026 n=1 Tax=Xyrichtys novacula TaxID=13765 RepID=A0AAV1G9S0_XYRNO|nr:LOW QUALITY PROTEIN: uncharacterized protein KIAA2026 [Xyrichtys novacula]